MPKSKEKKAVLALADGTVFEGLSIGVEGEATGEVVFNTSITGYQEILTDPSYCGQIITMTNPQIGNYGVNPEDVESRGIWASGFIVKQGCPRPSSWRSERDLHTYLKDNNVVGICGIDTRALVRLIREKGAMAGVISTKDVSPDTLVDKAQQVPGLTGRDLAAKVTCEKPYTWDEGLWSLGSGYAKQTRDKKFRVVAYDFGMKLNILRNLVDSGCDVTVVPASTTAKDVLEMDPDGIFLSNGPGDPAAVSYAIENIRALIGKRPVFGICLGHQILSLALGAGSYKLKFGHRGGNQPVKDLRTGRIEITSQNHGFAVEMESIKQVAELTHVNLNDNTVEGIGHKEYPLFSVQYHPEASPGPHDARYLFTRFIEMMEKA